MLGLKFNICVGSTIENTQTVYAGVALNYFSPNVNIITVPQIVVPIEVSSDEYCTTYVSGQIWPISSGEAVVALAVNRKDSDISIPQKAMDCHCVEVRINQSSCW